jgi:transcriptional regulator with XRE-family HTH domain
MKQPPDDWCAAVGLFVNALRTDAGMTMSDLARKAGLSASTIGNVESGAPMLVSTVFNIAQVFGYDLPEFLQEASEIEHYTTPRL